MRARLPKGLIASLIEDLYSETVSTLRARVRGGRLILDQPTNLPEGMTLDLVLDDEGDDLSPNERRALHQAISKAWKSAKAGKLRPAADLIREMRSRS